jgi:hypothetical protein
VSITSLQRVQQRGAGPSPPLLRRLSATRGDQVPMAIVPRPFRRESMKMCPERFPGGEARV